MIDVSIIIVTYQSQDEVLDCLNSIYNNVDGLTFEIIIADNCSTDNTVKLIQSKFPDIILVENKINMGFSFANNIASKDAKGDFLFFLNPDSILFENSIKILLSEYKSDNKKGIIGPVIKNIDKSIQLSSGLKPSISATLFEAFGLYLFLPNTLFGYRKNLESMKDLQVDWVSGACFLISKKVFNNLKGFDENFFLYLEDVDICLRTKTQMGKNILLTSKTSIIHKSGKSSKNSSFLSKISSYKSKLYFHKKYNNRLLYLLLIPMMYFAVIIKLIALILLFRNSEEIKSQFKVLTNLL